MEQETVTTKEEARIICSRLIPNTTSALNVDLISFALERAERRGYERGKNEDKDEKFIKDALKKWRELNE